MLISVVGYGRVLEAAQVFVCNFARLRVAGHGVSFMLR
jgi:hypothetical protein